MLQALESELQTAIVSHFAGCGSATTAANVAALEQALAATTGDIPILSRPYILELLLASCISSQNTKTSTFKVFDFYLTLPFRLAKGKSVNDSYDPALFCPFPSNGSIDATAKYWADKRPNTTDKDLFLKSISAFPQYWHVSQEELRAADYKLGQIRPSAATQTSSPSIKPLTTPITPLFRSILLRLRDFLGRLPPGVYAKQRNIDDSSKRLDILVTSLEALERLLMHDAVQALLKSANTNGDSKETDELTNLGINMKSKKSQKQKKKQARSGYMTEREEQQLRDVETLKKAGFHIPVLEGERQQLKDQINQELLSIYKLFIDAIQSKELVEFIKDRYKQHQETPTKASAPIVAKAVDEPKAVIEDKAVPAQQVLPPTYPHIQPLKAARLFECDSKDLGLWQLYFSSKSVSQLRQLDNEMQQIVVKKVQQLSNGHFSRDNMKTLKGTDKNIPIYEAKCSRDIRIIYQVDLHVNAETSMESQILKMWAIATHAEVDNRLWSAISLELSKARSPEYRKRVIERSTIRKAVGHGVDDCFDPISYARASSVTEPESDSKASSKKPMAEEDAIALHDLLALQKWMPYSRALINSTIAKVGDAKHAFLLSEHEQEVINHEGSAIVIGRSGTGKTSCALFRLIGIEETARLEGRTIKQVFVTKSPVLATKIKEYYHSLRQTLNLSTKPPKEEAKNKELDLWLTDDTDREKGLPHAWSQLQDQHFPLFLSFDHFSALLEADLGTGHLSAASHSEETRRLNSMLSGTAAVDTGAELNIDAAESQPTAGLAVTREDDWMHFVDLQAFVEQYWKHFDERLTKGLDPALCFSEFVGVIQGGEDSLGEASGCLSREAYLNLSLRAQATFAHAREQIYTLFLAYRAEKGVRGDWDAADRTHAILRAMQQLKLDLPKIEACYVDESQDNLLIDVALLRSVVSNPNGFLFAGDTAQSISVSTFRFEDLGACFYRAEERDPLVVAGARQALQPKTFNLLLNYRSHRGITNIGATLVEAIRSLFPDAIDALDRERGITEGTLPIVFDGFSDSSDLQLESFLFAGSEACEFGAMQCIIVRDEAARTELRRLLGDDFGLILTIYESKGLEFNDVLLYRFFSDSQATESQWRVILALLNDPNIQVPKLDSRKHSIILNELRNLYVAVTRARNRLWIFDTSSKAGPMKTLLAQRGLVQICKPTDPRPQMATSSSPAEWQATALKLFNQQLYSQSANAYSRAGKSHEASIALAYNQREKARFAHRSTKGSGKLYQIEFEKAAAQFENAANESSSDNNAEKLFRQAAQCYSNAAKPLKAAACHESAKEYTEAVRLYRLNKNYEQGLRILREHAPLEYEWLKPADCPAADMTVEIKEAKNMLQSARLYFVKEEQLQQAKSLFETSDDQLEWLEDYDFDTSALELLESLGKFSECARIHLAAGSEREAARFHTLAGDLPSAASCLYRLLLDLVPIGTEYATMADKSLVRSILNQLEPIIEHLDAQESSRAVISIIRQATRDKPVFENPLEEAANYGPSEQIMLLDAALQYVPPIETMSPLQLTTAIVMLDRYVHLLRPMCIKQIFPDGMLDYLGFLESPDGTEAIVAPACPFYAQLTFKSEGTIYCFYTSHHANGGLYYLYQKPDIWTARIKTLLYNEASDMLSKISRNLRVEVITAQLLLYSSLASIAAPDRFQQESGHTRIAAMASSSEGQSLLLSWTGPRRNFAALVYMFHAEVHLKSNIPVDVFNRCVAFIRTILDYNYQLELNVLLNMLETLFLMLMIGGKQGGRSIHGFEYQTLPEHLARQAVHLFNKSSIQFFSQVAQDVAAIVGDLAVKIMHHTSNSFRLDGAPLYNSAKPIVVYRLLRCMALVAYNNTNFRIAGDLRNHTLQQFHRIRNAVQTNQQNAQRAPVKFPEHIDALLSAKTWDDIGAAIRKGVSQPALDAVVELFPSGQPAKNIARGLRPVLSDSLDNLFNRWHGLPEIKVVPKKAITQTSRAAAPSTNLVPFQLYKKQTLETFAANSASAKAAELTLDGEATSENAEIFQPNGVDHKDDGHRSEGEELPEGDTSVAEVVIFEPLKEEEHTEEPLSEVKLASARRIAVWWRRCRRRRQLRAKDFTPAFKDALTLARSVPKTAQRRLDYMTMILVSHAEFKIASELLAKEADTCKRKATSRLVDATVSGQELEILHERISTLASLRRRIMQYRKTADEVLPKGSFDLTETELAPIDAYILELFDTPGNGAVAAKKAEISVHLAKGRRLFDKTVPPIQPKKKEKRPTLNTNEDDEMMDDGYISELDSVYRDEHFDNYMDYEQRRPEEAAPETDTSKPATIPGLPPTTKQGKDSKSAAKAKSDKPVQAEAPKKKKKKKSKKSAAQKAEAAAAVLEPVTNGEQVKAESKENESDYEMPELEPIISDDEPAEKAPAPVQAKKPAEKEKKKEPKEEKKAKEADYQSDTSLPALEPMYSDEDDLD